MKTKKILAFILAVTTCFCAFTACGDDDEGSGKKSSKKTSSSSSVDTDDEDEDKDDEEDPAAEKDDDEEKDNDEDGDKDSNDTEDKDDEKDKDSEKDKDDDKDNDKDNDDEKDDDDKDDKKDKDENKDKDKNKDQLNDINDELGEKRPATKEEQKTYTEVFTDVYNKAADGDVAAIVKCGLPDSTYKSMEKLGMTTELLGSLSPEDLDMGDFDINDLEVTSVRELDDDQLKQMTAMYGVIDKMMKIMVDSGLTAEMLQSGDIPEDKMAALEEFSELFGDIGDFEDLAKLDIGSDLEFEEYKLVTFEMDGEDAELPVYKIKGEERKIDMMLYPSMVGYVKKSKLSSASSAARTISKACNSSLVDLETQGIDLTGVYVICSNDKKNILESTDKDTLGASLGTLNELIKNYYGDVDSLDGYFMVIDAGVCKYVAVENDSYVGTYPTYSIISDYNDRDGFDIEGADRDDFTDGDYILSDLYDLCKKAMGK